MGDNWEQWPGMCLLQDTSENQFLWEMHFYVPLEGDLYTYSLKMATDIYSSSMRSTLNIL